MCVFCVSWQDVNGYDDAIILLYLLIICGYVVNIINVLTRWFITFRKLGCALLKQLINYCILSFVSSSNTVIWHECKHTMWLPSFPPPLSACPSLPTWFCFVIMKFSKVKFYQTLYNWNIDFQLGHAEFQLVLTNPVHVWLLYIHCFLQHTSLCQTE